MQVGVFTVYKANIVDFKSHTFRVFPICFLKLDKVPL